MADLLGLLGPRTTIALGVLAVYIAICRGLRFSRRDRKHARFPYKTQDDFKKMTNEDAWLIMKYCRSLEFPFTSEKALQFALFRTYGIPSISRLLVETKQFSDVEFAGRRTTDTGILIGEFLERHPTSERANSAIARMNYLHGMYQKAGKITNDDMLYTLSLFILEPERWIRMYEWRSLTPMEICAFGTFWKSMGDAMNIDFAPLAHGPNSFADGLQFFNDIRAWAEGYEKKTMVPDATNHKTANETTNILLFNAPDFLKPFGRKVVASVMDDRLRTAMIYDAPPAILPFLLNSILTIRRLVLTYLIPPRLDSMPYKTLSDNADPKTGRLHHADGVYDFEPWYVKPTFWARNRPAAWYKWATGKPYPDGKNWKHEGYHMFEVGPKKLEKTGHEKCAEMRDDLMGKPRGGCPFAVKM